MKIVQQYTKAVATADLLDDEMHHNTDVLAAVALSSNLGSTLFRAKFMGDQRSVKEMLSLWRGIIRKKAKGRSWEEYCEEVADISLWFWMDDLCQTCKGRGHPIVISTPTLAASTCPDCNGTGRKTLECDAQIKEVVKDAIQQLEKISQESRFNASKLLHG